MELTQKQHLFVLAYIELGNASQAYRRAYKATKMKASTVNRKAAELLANGKITARIDALRGEAAKKAVLDRAWVLERLMRNAKIAMGEERIKVAVRPKSAPDIVIELEITDRDAAAANRALELLGKADEVRLFEEQPKKDDRPRQLAAPQGAPGEDHLADIIARFKARIAGGTPQPDDPSHSDDPIVRRFRKALDDVNAG